MKTKLICIFCALVLSVSIPLSAAADASNVKDKCLISSGFDGFSLVSYGGNLFNMNQPSEGVATNVEQVSRGFNTSYYIRSGNTLYSMKNDVEGARPEKLADGVLSVSAGTTHAAFIKLDYSLWTVGANDRGQLGNGTFLASDIPVKVMDNVVAVSAGGRYTLALKSDKSLWAFGSNTFGQLGDGSYDVLTRPVKIMEDVTDFSAGYSHSLVVTSDSTLYAFGSNEFSKLGDGTDKNSPTPIKIMENIKFASAGYNHSAAIDKDGRLYVFGDNFHGQLGFSNPDSVRVPTQLAASVSTVSAGLTETVYTLENGVVYVSSDFGTSNVGHNVKGTKLPITALRTKSDINIDGMVIKVNAYNIEGSNYLKIRDISTFLKLSGKSFEVEYDEITKNLLLISGKSYTLIGGEVALAEDDLPRMASPSPSKIFLDGNEIDISIYKIGDNSYVKLRDMGKAFDFGVTFSAETDTVSIRSFEPYVEPVAQ